MTAIPLGALVSTSLIPETRAEMRVLFVVEPFEGKGVSL